MAHNQIAAVWFDWDLTLARVLGDVPESARLAALFQSQGLDFSPGEIQIAMRESRNGTGESSGLPAGKPQTRRAIINSYFKILDYLGYKERNWAFGNRLYDALAGLPMSLYDETLPVLQSLQQKGLALGIISNHARSVRGVIEKSVGEFVRPRHIIISQEIGIHKPAKTIFRHAASRMGLPSALCMLVGDSLVTDAIGAVERGGFGRSLWLDRQAVGAELALPERVYRITSLHQVLRFV